MTLPDVSADEFLSATKCVLIRELSHLQIGKHSRCHFEFVTRKRCFSLTVKFVIFQSFLIFVGVFYGCNQWLSIFSSATYRKRLQLSSINEVHSVSNTGKN